jgi:hypothetical protein
VDLTGCFPNPAKQVKADQDEVGNCVENIQQVQHAGKGKTAAEVDFLKLKSILNKGLLVAE